MNLSSYGSDVVVRPDEGLVRPGGHAGILDTSWSILRDRDVPHTCFTESFEDRSVEGLHMNSRFCLCQCCFEEMIVFQACAGVNGQTGGMFLRITQCGECVCFQSRG